MVARELPNPRFPVFVYVLINKGVTDSLFRK
jgi:hypothetical protein